MIFFSLSSFVVETRKYRFLCNALESVKSTLAYKLVVEGEKNWFLTKFRLHLRCHNHSLELHKNLQVTKLNSFLFILNRFETHSSHLISNEGIHTVMNKEMDRKKIETGTAFFVRMRWQRVVNSRDFWKEKIQKYWIIKWMRMLIVLDQIGKFDECLYFSGYITRFYSMAFDKPFKTTWLLCMRTSAFHYFFPRSNTLVF